MKYVIRSVYIHKATAQLVPINSGDHQFIRSEIIDTVKQKPFRGALDVGDVAARFERQWNGPQDEAMFLMRVLDIEPADAVVAQHGVPS